MSINPRLVTGWVLLVFTGCSGINSVQDLPGNDDIFSPFRKRRILYYDAASHQAWGYVDQGRRIPYTKLIADIKDHQDFLDFRTNLTFDTQVDTYLFHIGNGADPPYNIPLEMLWPCFESYEQVRDLVIEACHRKGMEVWASLRMNDLHTSWRSKSIQDLDDPFKVSHPEYLLVPENYRDLATELTEHLLWGGLDFTHPQVRQHRLAFIQRTASRHDFDGYELDFSRFGISFPLGHERQNAYLLTDLIGRIRSTLDSIGTARKRPYTLAVHVMDSVERSQELGMEVEDWLQKGLVDVLLVGMGHLPYRLRLDQWIHLGQKYQVPIYPTLNANAYRAPPWEQLQDRPVFQEGLRATSAYYHQEGADGLYIYNFANEPTQELTDREFRSVLNEIGELSTLKGKNKLYGIQSNAHSGGPIIQGSESALLPIVLDRVETKLPLMLGPDPTEFRASFRLSFWTAGSREDTILWVRLNHMLLPKPRRDGPWYHIDLPTGLLRAGYNELSLWCNVPAAGPFPGLVAPPGVRKKDWLGWKRDKSTLVEEFENGRLSNEPEAQRDAKSPVNPSPLIVHQVFVFANHPKS